MAEERASTGWALASFVLGTVFGAALALLLTPQPGEETREKLKRIAEKVKDIAVEKASELLEETKKKVAKEEGETDVEVEG
jgi:gas vesicle protein